MLKRIVEWLLGTISLGFFSYSVGWTDKKGRTHTI